MFHAIEKKKLFWHKSSTVNSDWHLSHKSQLCRCIALLGFVKEIFAQFMGFFYIFWTNSLSFGTACAPTTAQLSALTAKHKRNRAYLTRIGLRAGLLAAACRLLTQSHGWYVVMGVVHLPFTQIHEWIWPPPLLDYGHLQGVPYRKVHC